MISYVSGSTFLTRLRYREDQW